MNRVALVPWLISGGLFAATLSSALASFLGAPRILQALASDRLFGVLTPFAKGVGPTDNPRRGVLLSFAIAALTVALGDLNVVAPVVSMFFLVSYGLLNYATYYEASSASPSFRPRFRLYRPHISLLGCLACGGTMLAIDPRAAAIALAILFAIHQFLARTGGPDRWADGSRSALFHRVRSSLLAMGAITEHDRDWRPVVLAFSDDPGRRERIMRFATWIEGGSGLTTAVRVVQGEGALARVEARRVEQEMEGNARSQRLETFARVVHAADLDAALPLLLQACGLGPIRPNIALFNWFDREETAEVAPAMRSYGAYLRTALRYGCNVVVLAARDRSLEPLASPDAAPRRIDVVWTGDASSKLALLLAYLMSRREPWRGARLRILTVRQADETAAQSLAAVHEQLDDIRIPAEATVLEDLGWEAVGAASSDASLALVPLRVTAAGLRDVAGEPLAHTLEGMPPLALVAAAQDIDLEAQPDEGPQAEAAELQDARADAESRAGKLRARADELRAAAGQAAEQLAESRGSSAAAEQLAAAEKAARETEEAAVAAERKAIKAEVRAGDLAREAAASADKPTDDG
jgi:hypothetical protein